MLIALSHPSTVVCFSFPTFVFLYCSRVSISWAHWLIPSKSKMVDSLKCHITNERNTPWGLEAKKVRQTDIQEVFLPRSLVMNVKGLCQWLVVVSLRFSHLEVCLKPVATCCQPNNRTFNLKIPRASLAAGLIPHRRGSSQGWAGRGGLRSKFMVEITV